MKYIKINIIHNFIKTKRTFYLYIIKIVFLLIYIASLITFQIDSYAEESKVIYEIHFNTVEDKTLLNYLKSYSDLIKLKDRPPSSIRLLKKRADSDRMRFIKILKARGFFKGDVKIEINTNKSPVDLLVKVTPGPQFILKKIEFKPLREDSAELVSFVSTKVDTLPETPYHSGLIEEGKKKPVNLLNKAGFPFAKIIEHEITADHLNNTVNVIYTFDSGPKAVFGKITVEGLESVDQPYILNKIIWKQGELYNIDLIEKTHRKLTGSGLFTIVRIVEGESLDDNGGLPITINIKERKHKTIGAGLFYKTDEGPGIKFMWENRNLMGKSENFSANIELSDYTIATEETFRKPDFYGEDQNIRISLRLAEDTPTAFKSTYLETMAIIEKKLSEYLDIGGGIAYKSSEVRQVDIENSFNLFSFPLILRWDNTDDLLDPEKGNRVSVEVVPFYDTSGSQSIFTRGLIDFRYYKYLLQSPSIKLAVNLTVGSIYGAASYEIPADERFYSGGGGSIRGYAYQSVGPYFNGNPVGGRSLLEISIEPRIRLSEKLGLALFVDGGTSFEDDLFSSQEDILWGAGAGLRYFTLIGPLRIDIGFPLNKRNGIDDSFQFYLSLGQAF